jgi:transcriptional regulator with XRE-family HTH domain
MVSMDELARVLGDKMKAAGLTQQALRAAAGVSRQTLTNVLTAKRDTKLSTVFALADRLGLEVILVPKEVAPALGLTGESTVPVVRTRVKASLERLRIRP